jgi:CRISPR-associated endonuclease Csy4
VNKERLARRYSSRHEISYEDALSHYKDLGDKLIKHPFIKLKSLSSQNEFCLWIKKTSAKEYVFEKFNTYGLSGISTTPEF